jgi:U4/U6.U5 tri-snRNP component SNU23
MIGASTKVSRSTIEQVRQRILARKVKVKVLDPKERIDQRNQDELEAKMLKKEIRRLKREAEKAKNEPVQDEYITEMMGFGGFATSKK